MPKSALLSLFILLIFPVNGSFAQSLGSHGSLVFIDLNTGVTVSDNNFTRVWDAYPVWHLNIRVPFHSSQLEAGGRYIRYEGIAPTMTDSDFHSVFLHLGYGYPIQVTPRYQIGPAVRFGSNVMLFDEPEVFESGSFRFVTDTGELEFAYELALRNQLHITDHWYVHATLSYNRTLTEIPLPYTMISAGITYSIPQPAWLKNFIQ